MRTLPPCSRLIAVNQFPRATGVATVARVSVDIIATMRTPVALDQLVAAARETLRQLLGLEAAPVIEVFADWRRADTRRRLGAEEMRSTLIGERIPGPVLKRPSTCDFAFETVDGDGAWLMVADWTGIEELGGSDGSEEIVDWTDAIFSPHRTCVGVMMATALALAAASCGGGAFVDDQIRMLEPAVTQPDRVIELTRSPDRGTDFARRCERYLRQFPRLQGWPRDISLAS
jgi:hypothetical protein